MKTILTILAATFLCGSQNTIRAASTTLLSTVGSPEIYNTLGNLAGGVKHAIRFTTGSQSIQLDSIILMVQSDALIHTYLYSENNGEPGLPILEFPSSLASSTPTLVEFALGTPAALDSNTSYFIVVNAPDGIYAGWQVASTPVVSGTGDLTGGTERIYQLDGGPWHTDSENLLVYEIRGQVVPEPAGATLGSIGIFLLLRRRR